VTDSSVGSQRAIYLPNKLWRDLEELWALWEKKYGHTRSVNPVIAKVLEYGIPVFREKELK